LNSPVLVGHLGAYRFDGTVHQLKAVNLLQIIGQLGAEIAEDIAEHMVGDLTAPTIDLLVITAAWGDGLCRKCALLPGGIRTEDKPT